MLADGSKMRYLTFDKQCTMDIIVISTLDARVAELNPVPASEMDGVDDKRPSMLFIPVGLEALLQYTARRGFRRSRDH